MKLRKDLKIKTEVREALKNVGFTDYFINLYVGLLKEGEMNAHELSELTKVPYSRIYEVLNEMVRKNIITKLEGRPSTFIANNPDDVFTSIKKRQERHFQENAKKSLPVLKQLFGEKRIAKQEQIMVYQGEKVCQDHIRNVLSATARTLYMALNNMKETFGIIESHLSYLQTKGVEMNIIIEEQYRDTDFSSELHKFGKIKYLPAIEQNILVSDSKTGIQGIEGKFNIANPKDLEYALFSSNSAMYVIYLTEIFENLWALSKD